jgi:hypothetical protein
MLVNVCGRQAFTAGRFLGIQLRAEKTHRRESMMGDLYRIGGRGSFVKSSQDNFAGQRLVCVCGSIVDLRCFTWEFNVSIQSIHGTETNRILERTAPRSALS